MPEPTRRIAMWSGPRNLSTALMRAFGNRGDVAEVRDEPFYAAYLALTGKDHPMRAEVLAAQPQDWRVMAHACARAPLPPGKLSYQKHMTHHMLPQIDREWILDLTNVFLIRAPERVVASYAARREQVTLEDIGFLQQAELYDLVAARTGRTPPVIDAEGVRADPEGILRRLCDAIGIDFDPAMLAWPSGPRTSDGVWAPHWYGSVNASTGFAPPEPPPAALTAAMQKIADAARPAYKRLLQVAL
jgi:hypothetical protein